MSLKETFRNIFIHNKQGEAQVNPWPAILGRAYSQVILNGAEYNPMVDDVISHISNTVSVLPVSTFRYTKSGVVDAWYTDTAKLLQHPCVEESRVLFMKSLVRHLLTCGNAYIYMHRGQGKVLSLQLIDPHCVTQFRNGTTGRKEYRVGNEVYTDNEVIHIPYYGEGYGGEKGLGFSPLDIHKDVISENNYIREWICTFFQHGIGSKMLASMDSDIYKPNDSTLKQQIQYLKDFFDGNLSGIDNAGRVLLLPPGITTSTINLPNNSEAEVHSLLMESNASICRIFNMPPEILLSEQSKYGSLEARNQDYMMTCIRPLCEHIASYLEKLIPDDEIDGEYIAFSFDDMLETDIEKKQNRLMNAYHGGLITLNEFRKEMRLGSIENEVEGNTRFFPANLLPATEDVINSMMARSKLALKELEDKSEDKLNNHQDGGAADKTM